MDLSGIGGWHSGGIFVVMASWSQGKSGGVLWVF